jgi:hypothetical protein
MEHFFSTESKNDILDKNVFGNSDIKFNRNPLFPNIFKINDISDKDNKTYFLDILQLQFFWNNAFIILISNIQITIYY